jgi:Protein of unknown function (DUF402)
VILHDFDFHPDEDHVRVFTAGPGGILRFGDDACVYAVRYDDVVLWHYAFARHWFKVNLTTDLAGRIVETGGAEPDLRFAFNCDIATPMRRDHDTVYAVDLFTDVLVRADATTYRVTDTDEFDRARRTGLIQPGEARGAEQGLAELTGLIDRSELLPFLSRALPIAPLNPPAAASVARVPIAQVPLLSPASRASHTGHAAPRAGSA